MAKRKRGHGEGSIYPRADGRWEARVMVGYDAAGKPRRVSVYGDTRAEVQHKLDELRQKLRDGTFEQTDMTVDRFLEFWLAMMKTRVEPNTNSRYELDVSYLKPNLGKLPLAKLVPLHVVNLFERMAKDGYSTDAQFKAGTRLRQALKHAVKMKFLTHNPALSVPLPRHRRDEIHPLDAAQVKTFLAAAEGDRLFALYVVALDSGAREGELFALTWDDWFPGTRELVIIKSLEEKKGHLRVKDTKTPYSRRRIQLGLQAAEVLRQHREAMQAEGHGGQVIFCTVDGGHLRRPNLARRSFKPILERAGLPEIRFHDLRHTCATLLLQAGVDIKTIAHRLGHGSPDQLLKTYAHVLPAMQSRAAAVMDGYLTLSSQLSSSGV
jgi:integrase